MRITFTKYHEDPGDYRVMMFNEHREYECKTSVPTITTPVQVRGLIAYKDFFKVEHHTPFCALNIETSEPNKAGAEKTHVAEFEGACDDFSYDID